MKPLYLLLAFTLLTGISAMGQDTVPAPAGGRHNSEVYRKRDKDDNEIMTFDGRRSTSKVPSKFEHKRKVGMGLTIAGIGMLTTGIILVATAPRYTYYNAYGQTTTTTSPGGVIGFLLIPASLGITIPGAVIWGKYAHKIRTGATR